MKLKYNDFLKIRSVALRESNINESNKNKPNREIIREYVESVGGLDSAIAINEKMASADNIIKNMMDYMESLKNYGLLMTRIPAMIKKVGKMELDAKKEAQELSIRHEQEIAKRKKVMKDNINKKISKMPVGDSRTEMKSTLKSKAENEIDILRQKLEQKRVTRENDTKQEIAKANDKIRDLEKEYKISNEALSSRFEKRKKDMEYEKDKWVNDSMMKFIESLSKEMTESEYKKQIESIKNKSQKDAERYKNAAKELEEKAREKEKEINNMMDEIKEEDPEKAENIEKIKSFYVQKRKFGEVANELMDAYTEASVNEDTSDDTNNKLEKVKAKAREELKELTRIKDELGQTVFRKAFDLDKEEAQKKVEEIEDQYKEAKENFEESIQDIASSEEN